MGVSVGVGDASVGVPGFTSAFAWLRAVLGERVSKHPARDTEASNTDAARITHFNFIPEYLNLLPVIKSPSPMQSEQAIYPY